MAANSHSSIGNTYSTEQRFFVAIREENWEHRYVEFYDREIWGFRPSPYVYGKTRDGFIERMDEYYGEEFSKVHPQYRRYVLELLFQVPWDKLRWCR